MRLLDCGAIIDRQLAREAAKKLRPATVPKPRRAPIFAAQLRTVAPPVTIKHDGPPVGFAALRAAAVARRA